MSAAFVLAVLSNGCGLLILPRVQTFPGPVESIRVEDAGTGVDLEGASVRYEVIRHENWMHFGPTLVDDPDSLRSGRSARILATERSAQYVFTVESQRLAGSVQWFFPIPSPLGWNLYRDHEALVTAVAQGYRSLTLAYSPDNLPDTPWRSENEAGYCEIERGIVTFGLRSDSGPTRAPELDRR